MFLPIVAVEGCDASGKKTQTELLAKRYNARLVAFPRYQGPFGPAIMTILQRNMWGIDDPLILQTLMFADRYQAIAVLAKSKDKTPLIFDRYWQSGYSYGGSDGLNKRLILELAYLLPPPDLSVFLDVPIDEATRRRPDARDRYERDKLKLEEVRKNYFELWSRADDDLKSYGKHVIVDGTGSVDEVHNRLVDVIAQYAPALTTTGSV